jgi:uncharacterized protein YjbI with pentapeptide repeats
MKKVSLQELEEASKSTVVDKCFKGRDLSDLYISKINLYCMNFSEANLENVEFSCPILRIKIDGANVKNVIWPSWADVLRCNFGYTPFSKELLGSILLHEKENFDSDKFHYWDAFENGENMCPFIGARFNCTSQIFHRGCYSLFDNFPVPKRGEVAKELMRSAKRLSTQELAKRMLAEKCIV